MAELVKETCFCVSVLSWNRREKRTLAGLERGRESLCAVEAESAVLPRAAPGRQTKATSAAAEVLKEKARRQRIHHQLDVVQEPRVLQSNGQRSVFAFK